MIFDTHAHYTDEAFNEDIDTLLSSMNENNVGLIMNVASSLAEMPKILELAEKYPFLYAAVGIHPQEVMSAYNGYIDDIKGYFAHPKVKAIGEIGLDFYWTTDTKAEQQRILGEQIDLARELKKPIIIHDREAHGDTLKILKEHNAHDCGGVIHCYSGSAEMVREFTDGLGMYIAFGGTITFKNAIRPREAAKAVPLDKLLIETDSPYLSPVPHRGERNSSINLSYVVKMLSEIKGIPESEIEAITYENGKKLFNI